jgi:uncharacterized membrane protein YfcA
VSPLEFGLLVVAGVGAGLVGSMAGLASLISYPALLAVGVPPVTANMTNTVSMSLLTVGSVSASRPELAGQRRRMLRHVPAGVLGGAAGAALLMLTPSEAFEKVVPALIALASTAILFAPPPVALAAEGAREQHRHPHPESRWLPVGTFTIGVYGGYFGAAAGTLMLAMYLLTTGEGLPRGNALRNVVLGAANAVAAVGFVVLGSVAWLAALPLALGLFVGGRLGPGIVRRVRQTLLRRLIALAGLGLAVHLAVQAWT